MRQRASATAIVCQSSGHHRWDCGRLACPRRRQAFPHNDLSLYHPKSAGHSLTGMHRRFLVITLHPFSRPGTRLQQSTCPRQSYPTFLVRLGARSQIFLSAVEPSPAILFILESNPGSDSGCPRNLGQTPFCTLIDTISNPCYLLSQRLTSFHGGFRSCPQPVSAAQRRFFE